MEIVDRVHPRDIPTRPLCLGGQPLITYGRCGCSPLPEPVSQTACLAARSRRSIPLVIAPDRVILGVGLVGSGGFIALTRAVLLLVVLVVLLVLHGKLLSISLTVKY
jgi:hypothetical protein